MANIFEELMLKHQELSDTTLAESLKKKSVKTEAKKINFKKLRVESFKIFEEEDLDKLDQDFAADIEDETKDEDEVVLVIDPELPPEEEVPEDAAQQLVGDYVYKCPVCGANYVCGCDAAETEAIEVDEDGVPVECPVCGDDSEQILVGEIAPVEDVEKTEDEEEMEPVDNEDEKEDAEDEEVVEEESLKRRPLVRKMKTESKKKSSKCPECGKDPCVCENKKEEGCDSKRKTESKKKIVKEAPDRFGFEYDDEVSNRYAQELEKEKNFIADSRQRAEKLEAQIKEKLPDAVKMMETLPPNKEYWDKVIVPHQVEFLVTDSDVRVFYYATYPSKTEKIAGLGKDGTVKIWGYAGKPSEASFSTYPRYGAAIKAMQAFVDYFDQFKEEFYKKFPQFESVKSKKSPRRGRKLKEDFEEDDTTFSDDIELVEPECPECEVEEKVEEEPKVEVNADKVEIVLDDMRFNKLMSKMIRENYKGSPQFKLTKVKSSKNTLTLEYVVRNGKKNLKGQFVAEGFDTKSRTMKLRMRDKGVFTESLTKVPAFIVECVRIRNKIVPTSVRYNFTKKVNESLYRVKGEVKNSK